MPPYKKPNWWSDLWDSVLLVLILESLIVPWNGLNSLKRQLGEDESDQILHNKGIWPDLGDRETFVQDLSRNLYPDRGIATYIFDLDNSPTSVITQDMGATNFAQQPPENDELSLETQDLIDVLWRQDIDMEKSVPLTDIATPYNQHENDVQVLQQKTMPWLTNDFVSNEKDCLPLFRMHDDTVEKCTDLSPWLQESSENVKECEMLRLEQMQKEMDLLESMAVPDNSPPFCTDDVWLSQAVSDNASNEENTRMSGDSGFFDPDPTPTAAPPFDRLLSVDFLLTPDLHLSPTDQSQLFNNEQVQNDLADALMDNTISVSTRQPFVGPSPMVLDGEDDFGLGVEYLQGATAANNFKEYQYPLLEETPSTSTGITHYENAPTKSEFGSENAESESMTSHVTSREYEEWERPTSTNTFNSPLSGHDFGKVDILVKFLEDQEEKGFEEEDDSLAMPSRGRTSHDADLLRENDIPIPVDTIVNSSLEYVQTCMKKYKLSDKQMNIVKKIRRRGKNKVAARQCRARRVQGIEQLETETHVMKHERSTLVAEYRQLKELKDQEQIELARMKAQLKNLGCR